MLQLEAELLLFSESPGATPRHPSLDAMARNGHGQGEDARGAAGLFPFLGVQVALLLLQTRLARLVRRGTANAFFDREHPSFGS